ncbi:MAG: hypothetical protein V1732_04865 [Patescibacteria group bacterium]
MATIKLKYVLVFLALASFGFYSLTALNIKKIEEIPVSVFPIAGLIITAYLISKGKNSASSAEKK